MACPPHQRKEAWKNMVASILHAFLHIVFNNNFFCAAECLWVGHCMHNNIEPRFTLTENLREQRVAPINSSAASSNLRLSAVVFRGQNATIYETRCEEQTRGEAEGWGLRPWGMNPTSTHCLTFDRPGSTRPWGRTVSPSESDRWRLEITAFGEQSVGYVDD